MVSFSFYLYETTAEAIHKIKYQFISASMHVELKVSLSCTILHHIAQHIPFFWSYARVSWRDFCRKHSTPSGWVAGEAQLWQQSKRIIILHRFTARRSRYCPYAGAVTFRSTHYRDEILTCHDHERVSTRWRRHASEYFEHFNCVSRQILHVNEVYVTKGVMGIISQVSCEARGLHDASWQLSTLVISCPSCTI